jgi:hypothetical protein
LLNRFAGGINCIGRLERIRSVAPFAMVTVPAPDQCPDKPRNGLSEPGSAWACAEISKIPDAITAFLRQIAEGFKEKTAMNLPFQFPCHRSRAAVRL